MIKEFLTTLDVVQVLVLFYFTGYGLLHGIVYHLTVVCSVISGRGYTTDLFTSVLNWLWYGSIAIILYWFI